MMKVKVYFSMMHVVKENHCTVVDSSSLLYPLNSIAAILLNSFSNSGFCQKHWTLIVFVKAVTNFYNEDAVCFLEAEN
jgi:hypothetical protein